MPSLEDSEAGDDRGDGRLARRARGSAKAHHLRERRRGGGGARRARVALLRAGGQEAPRGLAVVFAEG